MTHSDRVTHSLLYVADKRPVLIFATDADASEFAKAFGQGAEIYRNKHHVFLPTPHGLEFVRGGEGGETAYIFTSSALADDWAERLQGYGVRPTEGELHNRTVIVGRFGHNSKQAQLWPGVA